MAGVDSNRPLQLAFVDLSLQPAHPLSFGVEHRDLVLHLDQRQAGHSLSQQLIEHCLERADDQADELVVMTRAHLGGHLIWMHRLLVQQLQDRKGEWREELGLELGLGHIPNGVYETGYTLPSTQPSIVVADGPWSYAMD